MELKNKSEYIGITEHGYDLNFILKEALLTIQLLPSPHMAKISKIHLIKLSPIGTDRTNFLYYNL